MNPYKDYTLDQLLLMPLSEEVLDQILEVCEQVQRTDSESRREANEVFSG